MAFCCIHVLNYLTLPPKNDEWVASEVLSQQASNPNAKSGILVTFALLWLLLGVLHHCIFKCV